MQGIDSIKAELSLREAQLSDKEKRLNDLQEILRQKDEEVQALKNKVLNALKGFVDQGLDVTERNGKVYVSMDEKLLFASGSWVVGTAGVNALKGIRCFGSRFYNQCTHRGHTDNVPYRGSAQVKDNWDLSVMRATAVLKVLLQGSTIDPIRVTAAGRGEYYPIVDNDTPESRAKNRRTEIILTPNWMNFLN